MPMARIAVHWATPMRSAAMSIRMVPLYVGYDEKLGERVERAERTIENIHDRAIEARERAMKRERATA